MTDYTELAAAWTNTKNAWHEISPGVRLMLIGFVLILLGSMLLVISAIV